MALAVVHGQLFTPPDLPQGIELSPAISQTRKGIWRAAVIDEAKSPARGRGINGPVFKLDDGYHLAAFRPPARLPDGDDLTLEFADLCPRGDRTAREQTTPADAAPADSELIVDRGRIDDALHRRAPRWLPGYRLQN